MYVCRHVYVHMYVFICVLKPERIHFQLHIFKIAVKSERNKLTASAINAPSPIFEVMAHHEIAEKSLTFVHLFSECDENALNSTFFRSL